MVYNLVVILGCRHSPYGEGLAHGLVCMGKRSKLVHDGSTQIIFVNMYIFTIIGVSPSGKAHGFGPCIRGRKLPNGSLRVGNLDPAVAGPS